MKILRVFPRKTKATPDDPMAVVGYPTLFDEADKVLIDCTFTWDKPEAEKMAEAWRIIAPVKIGGVAYGDPGGEFQPGLFLKQGYTITSRGCPNKCWFCYVWKRTGGLMELTIKDGWIVQDDNLLACSETHIRAVFAMLKRQPKKAVFSGGLEARLLKGWHIDLLVDLKPQQMFFAYDTPDDYEPLAEASKLLTSAGIIRKSGRQAFCYNLIGYPNDTITDAEQRLMRTLKLGFTPFAMLYKNENGQADITWRKFQREWANEELDAHNALLVKYRKA